MSSFHFSSKVLNLVDTRPKADELKGAVKLDPNLKEYLQFGDESVKKSILINQSNCLNSTTFVTFSRQLNTHFIMRPTVLPQILVHLTEMLVGILGICSDSSSVARRFGLSKVPRFFRLVLQLERPFYDLFRILVELFCRTWKDMNAKFDEINKDQFERSLFENPNSLEQLEIEMLRKRFSYFNMQKVGFFLF